MTRAAVAADEPEPQRFATGGIVTGPGITLGTDGCVWPNGPRTVVYPSGNVSVTANVSGWYDLPAALRDPIRTAAYVGEPIREIEP